MAVRCGPGARGIVFGAADRDTFLPSHDRYVEVFAGGAALYFLRPPTKVEEINEAPCLSVRKPAQQSESWH